MERKKPNKQCIFNSIGVLRQLTMSYRSEKLRIWPEYSEIRFKKAGVTEHLRGMESTKSDATTDNTVFPSSSNLDSSLLSKLYSHYTLLN